MRHQSTHAQFTRSAPSGLLGIAAELNAAGDVTSRFVRGHGVDVPVLIFKPHAVNGDRVYRVITDSLLQS